MICGAPGVSCRVTCPLPIRSYSLIQRGCESGVVAPRGLKQGIYAGTWVRGGQMAIGRVWLAGGKLGWNWDGGACRREVYVCGMREARCESAHDSSFFFFCESYWLRERYSAACLWAYCDLICISFGIERLLFNFVYSMRLVR